MIANCAGNPASGWRPAAAIVAGRRPIGAPRSGDVKASFTPVNQGFPTLC